MNHLYAWTIGHFHDPKDREKYLLELYAPLSGTDPDQVPESVAQEEMSMFYALKRQTSPGGD
jgi:hypothetical protein